MSSLSLDHVQLAIPANVEDRADQFYVGVLGLERIEKPEALARRGGRWYAIEGLQLHLGVDPQFVPSPKAHVALRVTDYEGMQARLTAAHARIQHDDEIPGTQRFYTWDPFGNRIEMIRA